MLICVVRGSEGPKGQWAAWGGASGTPRRSMGERAAGGCAKHMHGHATRLLINLPCYCRSGKRPSLRVAYRPLAARPQERPLLVTALLNYSIELLQSI